MKIKLIIDLPINKKYEAFSGKVFDVIRKGGPLRGESSYGYWCKDKNGEEFKVLECECEIVEGRGRTRGK